MRVRVDWMGVAAIVVGSLMLIFGEGGIRSQYAWGGARDSRDNPCPTTARTVNDTMACDDLNWCSDRPWGDCLSGDPNSTCSNDRLRCAGVTTKAQEPLVYGSAGWCRPTKWCDPTWVVCKTCSDWWLCGKANCYSEPPDEKGECPGMKFKKCTAEVYGKPNTCYW
jgi:hypothetical protein